MAAEENFENLSVEDRLAHKSWKARVSAYTELVTVFQQTVSESDPIFRSFVNNPATVQEWVRDSNAVSQEKGVEAACALIEHGGSAAARSRSEVVPAVIEKCLGSARAGTRTKALELCLLYVESEEDKGEGVIQDVISGLAAKQPKVVAGSVTVLKEIVRLFGTTTINYKPILQILPKIFAHADKAVRAEGTLLCLALHSFLGPSLTPFLAELKPVQVKELTDGFADADAKGEGFGAKQSRFTKSQQRVRAVKEAEGALEGNVSEEVAEVEEEIIVEAEADPYLNATPIDVNELLPTDFYTHIASAKWKDRKDLALDPLLAVLKSSLRVKAGNYDELTRALGARMTDANVVCMMGAANCLEALALGLRTDFGRYKSNVLTGILERTKEKKQNVLDALGGALDAIFLSVPFSDIVEEFCTFGKHKNPSVKAETFKWLVRSLKIIPTAPSKSDSSLVAATLVASLGDSGEPVRVAAAEGLGTLMKCVGEEVFSKEMDGLDALRKEKVMEQFGKAEVKCKKGGFSPSRAAAPPAPIPVVAKPIPKPKPPVARPPMVFDDAEQPPPPSAPVVRPLAKVAPRPLVKKPVIAAPPVKKPVPTVTSTSSTKSAPAKGVEALRYKFNQEEAEALAETSIPSEIITGLSDSNWKTRLGAIESLHDWLSGGEIENVESELIVRYLSKKPGWKESNFQVGAKMFGIFQLLAETSPSFSKASAALSIPALSDKLGDMKLKKPAGDALSLYAEKSSIQFVLSQAYEPMTKQKAPKAQADSLVWVEQSLQDFGIAGLSIRELIDFLKNGLKSSNAAVRTSATKTIVTLKLCVGSTDISSFIQDLNPALLTTIEAEFEKISGESRPEPTRFSADNAAAASSAASNGGAGTGKSSEDAALDELFPRVDLEKILTSSNVNNCNDANWKTRKEALEHIQSTLEEHKRLKPTNISDLTAALKARLADSNKVVQGLALDIVARLATGMGKPFERQSKILAGPIAAVLADQKANIRLAGVTTLSAIAENCGLDSIVPYLDKPLEAQNPILRKELLTWLETQFDKPEIITGVDLTPIAGPVIACLEDRNVDVRKAATALLPMIISSAGYNVVLAQLASLKPASRNTVLPLLEAARGSGSAPPPPKTAPIATIAARAGLKPLRRPEPAAAPTPAPEEVPRAISRPRPSLTSAKPKSTASSARSTPVPQVSSAKEPPFKSADGQPKLIRQSKDVGSAKWLIDGNPRPEQIEQLYNQMAPHTSPELLAQLFSKDHNAEKDFVAGLILLDECAKEPNYAETQYELASEELAARMVANVDLMFKYVTVRLVLSSTVITVKCLDLIDHLIPVMHAERHRLSDYEVNALLVSLIAKVGDGKETIRQRVRAILKSFCTLYPFSKVFSVILDNGLISKNSRTRAESAEELGSLLQRYGVNSFPIAKALPLIARLISDRDAAVRTAALIAIGSAYTLIGSDLVYKYIGPIPDKERTMLAERLKRTASPTKSSANTAPGTPSRLPAPAKAIPSGISRPAAAPTGLRRPTSVAVSSFSGSTESIPRATQSPAPSRISSIARAPLQSTLGSAFGSKRSSADSGPVNTTRLISAILTDDPVASTIALKALEIVIGSDQESLIPVADRLIDAIVQQLQVGFDNLSEFSSESTFRLCRHLTAALSGIFDQKGPLGISISAEALCGLLAELAGRLLDTADVAAKLQVESDKGKEVIRFSKALNIILIKVFSSSNQTSLFTALFAVLKDATRDLRELQGEELTERAKYAELVMKVSKSVKESLENNSLSPSRILKDIDQFLETTPPAEWRRRATDNIPLADMPLRTVKTVLQQIVSVCGVSVFDKLYEIDSAENSYVYQYVFRLVNNTTGSNNEQRGSVDGGEIMTKTNSTVSIARAQPPREVTSPQLSNDSATTSRNGSISAPHSNTLSDGALDIATNNELKLIFDRIGDPGQSRAGIAELYEYRKLNPIAEAKIQIWMATTGNYFQTYLRRALDNLAISERERTTSAGSMNDSVSGENSRPLSTISSRSDRRNSLVGISGTSPRAPRSPRIVGPLNVDAATPSTRKLQELQSLFGFKDAASGRME